MTQRQKYLLGIIACTMGFIFITLMASLLFFKGFQKAAFVCVLPALLMILGQIFCILKMAKS
ncbi:MAG: hypothetical protein IKZ88_06815 [Neisseriaceae bacterium]|nr:hypothetical protein [Neisseriaceae bacterium]